MVTVVQEDQIWGISFDGSLKQLVELLEWLDGQHPNLTVAAPTITLRPTSTTAKPAGGGS